MFAPTSHRRPILVTGLHRSGTTWVGHMLSVTSHVHYVHEPFAPMYDRGWAQTLPPERYRYEAPGRPSVLDDDLDRIVALRPPWIRIARRAGGLRNTVRTAQEAAQAGLARHRGARTLIKDPFALLLAGRIAERSGAAVLILVRHPAGFVGSIKRSGWRLDTRNLLGQPELMRDHLEPFREQLERDVRRELDVVDHASLLWCALNSVVRAYEERYPEWIVARYEDLAPYPTAAFRSLYGRLAVPWSQETERVIAAWNAPSRRTDVTPGYKRRTRRDSPSAARTWSHHLTEEEVARVHAATGGLAGHWYDETDWMRPAG
jgi:hypothetical protein